MSTKREIFIWKKDDDIKLLREVIHEEPYKFPVGSTKRGAAWTKIADNLVRRGIVKATQRSVRNRFNSLMEEYHAREKEEKKASGVEVEFDEAYQALTEIDERMSEWEEKSQEKEATEKETAEDMRRKAVERLSSTRKRKKTDGVAGESDNNSDDGVSPSKKKSSHTNLVSMMEASIAMKKTEQEEHRQLRHRELDLRAAEMQQQQQFQTMLLHQQQQQQQQQQALNMAMLNTVNQLLKHIKNH